MIYYILRSQTQGVYLGSALDEGRVRYRFSMTTQPTDPKVKRFITAEEARRELFEVREQRVKNAELVEVNAQVGKPARCIVIPA